MNQCPIMHDLLDLQTPAFKHLITSWKLGLDYQVYKRDLLYHNQPHLNNATYSSILWLMEMESRVCADADLQGYYNDYLKLKKTAVLVSPRPDTPRYAFNNGRLPRHADKHGRTRKRYTIR